MNIKILKSFTVMVLLGIVLNGCGNKFSTVVSPDGKNVNGEESNRIYIHVDREQEWTIRTKEYAKSNNMKYAFASASKSTLDAGYKYFSIVLPFEGVRTLGENNSITLDEAVETCKDTFSWFWWNKREGCDSSIMEYQAGFTYRYPFTMTIVYHNDETQLNDSTTFDAEKILKEAVGVYRLNPEYFERSKK